MTDTDSLIATILRRTESVAVVGFSANVARPSYGVAQFWVDRGVKVIGVNPGLAGQVFFGQPVCADIASLPDDVDMIDIFRQSDAVSGIIEDALVRFEVLPVIWLQLDIYDDAAVARAVARGAEVIQDRCPKIEAHRLSI